MAGRGTPQGDVENVQQGMEELLELAASEGPPDVPENIGNVQPAPTRPQRQPERLQTAEEEMLERQVNGLPVGKQRTRDDTRAEVDETEDQAPRRRARRDEADADAEARDDDDAREPDDDAELDAEDDEQEPDVVDEIEGRGRRRAMPRWMQDELARRDQQIALLQGQVQAVLSGRAALPAAAAATPEPPAAPEPITLENAVPFELGEDFIEQLRAGDPKQAATLMRAALGVTAYRLAERLAQQYAHLQAQQPRPEALIAQHAAAQREKADLERAFYGTHRDIDPERHGELVQYVSSQLRPRLIAEGRFSNKTWLDETAREVRRMAGIRRAATGRRSVTRALEDGDDTRRSNVRPIRPAYSETATATGRGHGGKKPLTPMQKEMLDLARYA